MSNINRLVQESELILENLIDQLFNLFGKPFDRSKISLQEYNDLVDSTLKRNESYIKLRMEYDTDTKVPYGRITIDNDISYIVIYIPKNTLEDNNLITMMFDTILHELTHVISNRKISLIKTIKRPSILSSSIIKITALNLQDLSKENAEDFLNYVFNIREFANYAFTVAYALRNDFKNDKFSVTQFYKFNNSFIDRYFNGETKDFTKWTNKISHSDAFALFEIQLAIKYLNNDKMYHNRLQKFIKLCIKYQNRLHKLLGQI